MSEVKELWRAKCVIGDDVWNIGDIIYSDENGYLHGKNSWASIWTYKNFEEFNLTVRTKWELIPQEEQLKPEEVIELLSETIYNEFDNTCIKVFGRDTSFFDISISFTPSEIIQKLTEYKKSKLITSISKLDYDKIATDKLNEIYPNGWKVEE